MINNYFLFSYHRFAAAGINLMPIYMYIVRYTDCYNHILKQSGMSKNACAFDCQEKVDLCQS